MFTPLAECWTSAMEECLGRSTSLSWSRRRASRRTPTFSTLFTLIKMACGASNVFLSGINMRPISFIPLLTIPYLAKLQQTALLPSGLVALRIGYPSPPSGEVLEMPSWRRFPASREPHLSTQVLKKMKPTNLISTNSGGFIGGANSREGVMLMVEESLKQAA